MSFSLYRYSKREFNQRLYNIGSLRIGTLFDFRNEKHGFGIVDKGEAAKNLSRCHTEQQILKGERHVVDGPDGEKMELHGFKGPDGYGYGSVRTLNSTATIKDLKISQNIESPDMYVFCLSWRKSLITMHQFEGADSCLEIKQVNRFLSELTNTINGITPVDFLGRKPVIYKNRNEIWDGKNHGEPPAYIKPNIYLPQGEYRALWKPKISTPISPIIIGNYKLGNYCSEVFI